MTFHDSRGLLDQWHDYWEECGCDPLPRERRWPRPLDSRHVSALLYMQWAKHAGLLENSPLDDQPEVLASLVGAGGDDPRPAATAETPTGSTSGWVQDRWFTTKSGTMAATAKQLAALSLPDGVIPGMNFRISRSLLRVTVTTTQASLAPGDYFAFQQFVEGPDFRELQNDVHSVSLLVRSSVAGLKFGISLRDPPTATKTLTKLCTIPTANTWALVALPGLPVWPSGNFSYAPGLQGYLFQITLAAGTTWASPANDTWQSGSFLGAVGQSNFQQEP